MQPPSSSSIGLLELRYNVRHETGKYINHDVCRFANNDTSLPQNAIKEFSDACSSFVAQAGDLDCFKYPNCAKL